MVTFYSFICVLFCQKNLKKNYSNNSKIKILRNSRNFGPSHTRNHGIKNARGEFVAFCETDMEVDPNWLNHLIKKISSDQNLGAVQSKVLDINKRGYIQS